ncbi:MAG: family 1 glycosylhydrolase [Chloroflexota bacterium]|nr:family 1 glycosylhydrolase [Chloroflexota bacterium]
MSPAIVPPPRWSTLVRPPLDVPGFFFGGYECSTQVDRSGRRRDMVAETQHDRFRESDYAAAHAIGFRVIREGVPWHKIDVADSLDLAHFDLLVDATTHRDLIPIWDLFHYGFPEDLDPFKTGFAERFARYAGAIARRRRQLVGAGGWYTPVNEPSFMAWAGGEVGWFAPFGEGRGYELKMRLVRAAIGAMAAIRSEDPGARFVNADPACHAVAPADAPELADEAAEFTGYQWQAWDMLAGRGWHDFGGGPELLDVIGVNYYLTGQWEHRRGGHLAFDDPRRKPFREMLADVARRYPGHPIVVAETGCWGDLRVPWLRMIAEECDAAIASGVPLMGVCIYPLIDMTEWHAGHWMRIGAWEVDNEGGSLVRRPYAPLVAELVRRVRTPNASRPRLDQLLDSSKPIA